MGRRHGRTDQAGQPGWLVLGVQAAEVAIHQPAVTVADRVAGTSSSRLRASAHVTSETRQQERSVISHLNKAFARLLACVACACFVAPVVHAEAQDDGSDPLVINGCNIWPRTRCPGADLRHANLSARNLAGADFSGANLARVDLRLANVAGANFDGANLTGARLGRVHAPAATFRGAKLVGADLEMARLFRTDFSNADLTGANLEAARMTFAWVVGARLVDANLQETKFNAVNLTNADLSGSFLRYTIFPDSTFDGCTGCPKGWE
ncbi:MAG TPA: pentapeptide repeat-containing protein [Rhodocyclaceae bacterium]|nr:pentapeptide repeat-containing protein [Rhodocyclaceae bacterium]